jgi:hypothetical protein
MKEASMWRCSELGSHAEVLRTDMGISTGSIKNIQMLQVLSGKKRIVQDCVLQKEVFNSQTIKAQKL